MMKRAFTLIEVNLAMLIMAGGILSLVGLYSFGFRENAQSVQDVDGAAFAHLVIAELTKSLSQTDLSWQDFDSIETSGWRKYLQEASDKTLVCQGNPSSVAGGVFDQTVKGNYKPSAPNPPSGLMWGLAVLHEQGSAVVTIAVRVGTDEKTFMYQPAYHTSVRFQGVQTVKSAEEGGNP